MMRTVIAAALVLTCGLCLAEDFPEDTNEIKSLTAEQAADLVGKFEGESLWLNYLNKIDKDVAQELAKFKGTLFLGLTSIDKDVAMNLGKFKGKSLWLIKLTSIDKDVAQELANFRSKWADPDALVQASAHLHQAMKPLDELLFRSKSGVDWRAYLYWPWLEAQAAAGQNLDVNVLRVLYSRFNANENGLEMYQFVTVRRSLAAAIVQAGKYKNRNEGILNLSRLTSIDEVSLTCLRSNTAIFLPEKYRD